MARTKVDPKVQEAVRRLAQELHDTSDDASETPRVVIVGGLSAGEASLVETVSGITLSCESGTWVRCFTECFISASATQWSCTVSLRYLQDTQGGCAIKIMQFSPSLSADQKSDVGLWIRRAQAALFHPTNSPEVYKSMSDAELKSLSKDGNGPTTVEWFSRSSMIVDIIDPDGTEVCLVNLPGLSCSAKSGELLPLVQNVIADEIQDPSSIVLVTRAALLDMSPSQACQFASVIAARGTHNIGIITKPDCIVSISVQDLERWITVLKNNIYPLSLGYYCVYLPHEDVGGDESARVHIKAEKMSGSKTADPWRQLLLLDRVGVSCLQRETMKELMRGIERVYSKCDDVRRTVRRRPGSMDISFAIHKPSALSTARWTTDIRGIEYPKGTTGPKVEYKSHGTCYDRAFLLQFMTVCSGKPDSLTPLETIGLVTSDQESRLIEKTTIEHHTLSQPPQTSLLSSTTPNLMSFGDWLARYTSAAVPFNEVNGGPDVLGSPITMASPGNRRRSQRGGKQFNGGPDGLVTFSEPVEPLQKSANRWIPYFLLPRPSAPDGSLSIKTVQRKVKTLLNKLTAEKFNTISDQIIAWANTPEQETDGQTLARVIRLVFESATRDTTHSSMYAQLCRKLLDGISPNIQDSGIKRDENQLFSGAQIFHKYLLTVCQDDFARGLIASGAATATTAGAAGDTVVKDVSTDEESEKAKREWLGLIHFMGELFKVQVLSELVVRECVGMLLSDAEPPEEEIAALCTLMSTAGQTLDNPQSRSYMDIHFARMKELHKSPKMTSRIRFMLQDVIELREREWKPRNQADALTTIDIVHAATTKSKAVYEKRRTSLPSGGVGPSHRGVQQVGSDRWAAIRSERPRPRTADVPSTLPTLSTLGLGSVVTTREDTATPDKITTTPPRSHQGWRQRTIPRV